MTFITQPKKEGETKTCPNCDNTIVGRLKEYKDYPSKIQWQNEKETKAHYDKDGNCAGTIITQESTVETTNSTVTEDLPSLDFLDTPTKNLISNETLLLYHIRNQVESTIKKYEVDPHGGMIGQFTELIWKKYFGAKEV